MFRQNALVPQNLTREHEEKEYFLLYYQFIKHAFGIDYCNPNENDQVVLKLYFDKLPGSNRRGKRTIAKEKLYKDILRNIKGIYPNFNIGVSTSSRGDFVNNWKDPYRHWCFKSKNSVFDSSLTKNPK